LQHRLTSFKIPAGLQVTYFYLHFLNFIISCRFTFY
jgi:hypothetical protein